MTAYSTTVSATHLLTNSAWTRWVPRRKDRSLNARMTWLQWATPATTARLLVLDASSSAQQRVVAGLLEAAASVGHRS